MKTCRKCGVEFDGVRCVSCRKIYMKKYLEDNKEKLGKQYKDYRAANLEKIKIYQAEYRKQNAEKIKDNQRQYTKQHSDKKRLYDKAYRKANAEKMRKEKAAWLRNHPEVRQAMGRARRARKKGAKGKLSAGIDKNLFKLQKGKCACCKQPLGDNYHLDHIMPLALGGAHADVNMQLLKAECNMKKNAKHPVDFMQERGFLL